MKNKNVIKFSMMFLLFLITIMGATALTLTDGLEAYYSFDSDCITDSSANSHTGSNFGSTNVAGGKINNACNFVRTNTDYMNTNFYPTTKNMTFCGWFKSDSTHTYSQWAITMPNTASTTYQFGFFQYANSNYPSSIARMTSGLLVLQDTTNTFSLTTFEHYCISRYELNGSTYSNLYHNSTLVNTTNGSNPLDNTDRSNIKLGYAGFETGYDGTMDEIGIWNRTLTGSEISQLYNSGSGYSPFTLPDPVVVDWDTLPALDGTIQSSNFTLQYNLSQGDLNVTCDLKIDNVVDQTDVHTTLGLKSFNIDVGAVGDGDFNFVVECTNSQGTQTTTTKMIRIDTSDPFITINTPTINSTHYIVDGIPVDIEFLNTELNNTRVELYDLSSNLLWSDVQTGLLTNVSYLNTTIPQANLSVGELRFEVYSDDTAHLSTFHNVTLFVFNCPEKVEDWQPQYTTCSVYDNQTLTYQDANSCDTYFDLPVDNNSVVSCNYCTAVISNTTTSCVAQLQNISYSLDNSAVCCDLTNISADCNIPADQTNVSCSIATYSADDLAPISIDFLSKVALILLSLASLIAVTMGYTWAYDKVFKRK